jgi:uncharacterized protein YprB with RNaseH-like and TPR domain
MNILAWDLECSGLNADYGIILCAGFKYVGQGKPKIISIQDFPRYQKNPTDDRDLCKAIYDELIKADCWLTWFGTYFDIPFINTRLLYHGLPTVPANYPHIDGWKTARNRLKLRNNRLVTVQDFLGLETEKDAVKGPIWIKAMSGDPKALRYITTHCRKDVLELEEAYLRLRSLILDHPNTGVLTGDETCPTCGSKKMQKRGFHLTRTRRYQRYQCQECGAWSKERKPITISTRSA